MLCAHFVKEYVPFLSLGGGGTKTLDLTFMLTFLHNDPLWAKIKWTLRSFKVDFQAKLHPRGLNMHTGWYNPLQLCACVYFLQRVLRTFRWQLSRTKSGRLLPAMTDPLRVVQRNYLPTLRKPGQHCRRIFSRNYLAKIINECSEKGRKYTALSWLGRARSGAAGWGTAL